MEKKLKSKQRIFHSRVLKFNHEFMSVRLEMKNRFSQAHSRQIQSEQSNASSSLWHALLLIHMLPRCVPFGWWAIWQQNQCKSLRASSAYDCTNRLPCQQQLLPLYRAEGWK